MKFKVPANFVRHLMVSGLSSATVLALLAPDLLEPGLVLASATLTSLAHGIRSGGLLVLDPLDHVVAFIIVLAAATATTPTASPALLLVLGGVLVLLLHQPLLVVMRMLEDRVLRDR